MLRKFQLKQPNSLYYEIILVSKFARNYEVEGISFILAT